MSRDRRTLVTYATSSKFKREEVALLEDEVQLGDVVVNEVAKFECRSVAIKETLEVDLATMVRAEAREAYRALLVPCIVEHAGLIFDDYAAAGYPGGLTKPLWNTLGDNFVEELGAADRPATAKAVVGYCDGQSVRTFVGEVRGHLTALPRGDRSFYWDTVFVPNLPGSDTRGRHTYAEIVEQQGLAAKVGYKSQSTIAILDFLTYRLANAPVLWPAR